MTEDVKIEDVIEKTEVDGLHMIPSSPLLAGVEKALANEVASECILKNKLERIPSKPWDYLLMDCPPTLGILSLNALTLAKEVLVPVEVRGVLFIALQS